MLQDVSGRGTWRKNLRRCLSGRHLEQECFKMSLSKNASKMPLAEALGARMLQDVSGRGPAFQPRTPHS